MALLDGDHVGLNLPNSVNTDIKKSSLVEFQKARLNLSRYLAYGQMLSPIVYSSNALIPPAVIMGDAPLCTTNCWCLDGNACTPKMQAKMNPIYGAYWWENGESVLILANLDKDRSHTTSIKMLPQLYGARVQSCSLDGKTCENISSMLQNNGRDLSISQMQPLEIRLLKFGK
jgi:hypothetical protein